MTADDVTCPVCHGEGRIPMAMLTAALGQAEVIMRDVSRLEVAPEGEGEFKPVKVIRPPADPDPEFKPVKVYRRPRPETWDLSHRRDKS